MRRTVYVRTVVALVLLVAAAATSASSEALSGVAAAVVEKLYPEGRVLDVVPEQEDGVELFEVLVQNGTTRVEIEITDDGQIGEIESLIALADVPSQARARLTAEIGDATLDRIERHERHARFSSGRVIRVAPPEVYFEAKVGGAAPRSIAVSADGRVLPADDDDRGDDDDDDEGEPATER
jgi:hypothetical protein